MNGGGKWLQVFVINDKWDQVRACAVIGKGAGQADPWHYLPLPEGATRAVIVTPGRGGGRPGGLRDRTGGLQGGAPWRVRGLGRPWWIRGLGRPWRIRGLWRPWRIRGLWRPWRIRGLWRPWRIRELWRPWWNWRPGPYLFRWVREFRGLCSAPIHPGRGYKAPPPNFLGEVPLCWALRWSVLCGALGKR